MHSTDVNRLLIIARPASLAELGREVVPVDELIIELLLRGNVAIFSRGYFCFLRGFLVPRLKLIQATSYTLSDGKNRPLWGLIGKLQYVENMCDKCSISHKKQPKETCSWCGVGDFPELRVL